MQIETLSTPFELTHKTADSTDATFPSKIPTVTEPSGNGVLQFGEGSGSNGLMLVPVGTGANNAVLTGMRIIAWTPLRVSGTLPLWVPVVLCEFAAVFGNVTGASGGALGTSYFFMDTITIIAAYSGADNISHEIISNAGDLVAHVIVDTKGAHKIEVTFDLGANATAANCLAKRL